MEQPVNLVIFATDAELVDALKRKFTSDSNISVVCGNGPEVTKRMTLDAMWMTPMQSSYFGVTEPLIPHVARVFPMPAVNREKGMPRLLVAGVALVPGKEYTSKYLATIPATALAKAVEEYNALSPHPILRVGSNPHNLGLDNLDAIDAIHAVKHAFASSPASATQVQKRQTQSA